MIGAPEVEVKTLLVEAQEASTAGDLALAETIVREALRLVPGDPECIANLAMLAFKAKRSRDALELIQRALKADPTQPDFHFIQALASTQAGDLDAGLAGFRRAIARKPDYYEAWTNLIFGMDLHHATTWQRALEIRQQFDARFCQAATAAAEPHTNVPDPDRKLRVGYVGADFRGHSAASAFAAAIWGHSAMVMPFIYSTGGPQMAATEEFTEAAFYRDTSTMDGATRAQEIRRDQIDILVDLAAYSAGGALSTFAHRPAPIQVSAWGYLTGTGLGCMDYLFADAYALPTAHGERYTEDIVHLPACLGYWGADVEQFPELAVGPPPEEVNGYRTFGYLGRAIKLGPLVFDTWAELLSAVPTARLLLKSDQYADREQVHRVINALVGRGIDQGRLDVRGATDRRTHLLAHHEVDVCLDPFPQGGGATAGDCLWMGVPMVTLAGERICERIGTSLNMQAGRPDDIVTSRADYVRRAMQVTSTAPERQAIRTTFEASPSMDRGAYARAVEHAYRMLWRRWCAEGGRTVAA